MPDVLTFERSMIRAYLDAKEWNFLMDRDGDFQINFAEDDETGYAWTVYFSALGQNSDIYQVRVVARKDFAQSQWAEIISLCNDWNRRTFWPNAYLSVGDPATSTVGQVVVEYAINLGKGIHQELLDEFTDCAYYGALNFWKWAHGEKGL